MSLGLGVAAASGSERRDVERQEAPSLVLEVLESWLRAVDEHQPGIRDAPVATVSPWSGPDLGALLADGLLPLLRACDRPLRQDLRTVAGITTPRPRRGMSDDELVFIRKLALAMCRPDGRVVRETPPGPSITCFEAARSCTATPR